MTWGADLIDQLDFYWTAQFRPRLEGLSDQEYLWEPVPCMWSVRPDAEGRLVADFLVPEPPIPPVTTIAWRLDHVAREVLGKRARALFGGSPAGDAEDIDMYDERHWPEPRPATASDALAELDLAYRLWRDGAAARDDEALARPLGPRGAAFAESSLAQLVLHINREVMAHGAEICLLRDLYRAERDAADPLVAAALAGDADAVRGRDVTRARPSLAAEAAGLRHWEVVAALAEGGAPTDGALHYAAAADERATAESLLAHGADPRAVDDRFGLTPAGWAAHFGHADLAERLKNVERGGAH
ncbi:MAG: DinB family protein [Micropruina sp.]|uniref:DinB family protein n=1 Tax=Micropruina sp. TaxID=2737536 RepID=UPI0039E5D81F